jgi:branched-chain amino acid aminotransferase
MVSEVDGFHYEQSGVLSQLRDRYMEVMRGDLSLPGIELLPLIHEPAQAASN